MSESTQFYEILKANLRPEHLLDHKVSEFISKYLGCRSVRQAAKESQLTYQDGKYLYNQLDINTCIQKLSESEIVKYGYDAAEVVERTKELAFADPAEMVDNSGAYIKNIKDIPAATRRAIKKIRVKNIFEEDINGVPQYKGEIIDYEFWDKPKALELIGREKDTFKKTTVVEHDVSKNARNFLLASVARADEAHNQLTAPKDAQFTDAQIIDITPKDVTTEVAGGEIKRKPVVFEKPKSIA